MIKKSELPKGWRKGQMLFNWLEWLLKHGVEANQAGSRAADTFYMSDEEFNQKWNEYLREHNLYS